MSQQDRRNVHLAGAIREIAVYAHISGRANREQSLRQEIVAEKMSLILAKVST
jgi:hypothetical protein